MPMYCSNCHRQINDEAKFCTFCGTKVAPSQPSPQVQTVPSPAPSSQPAPSMVYQAPAPQPSPAPQPAPTYQAPAPPAPQPSYYPPAQPQAGGKTIPQPLAGVLQLNFNETLQNVFGAEYQDRRSAMDEDGPRTYVVAIAVTNQRLIFFLSSGVLKKTYQPMEAIALEQVQDVSISQGIIAKNFSINFVRNGLMNGLNLSNPFFVDNSTLKSAGSMDLGGVKAMLDASIAARKREVGAPAPVPSQVPQPQPVPVPVPAPAPQPVTAAPAPQYAPSAPGTYAELKYKLNMAGFDVKTIRCSRCGSLIFLPDQGVSIQCATCQNIITAQEILDRARDALR